MPRRGRNIPVVLTKETAELTVSNWLKNNNFKLISSDDKSTSSKVKSRNGRGFSLLEASNCFYIKFGQLKNGKQDKILCKICMVQQKRGGKYILHKNLRKSKKRSIFFHPKKKQNSDF